MNKNLLSLYKKLSKKYGKLIWWSKEKPFEIMLGAILVQNTNWKNAAKAMSAIKKNTKFNAKTLIKLPSDKLIKLIKPAGLYNQKAPRIKAICNWYKNKYHFNKLKRKRTTTLRKELLSIHGVGNETADAILLYAFKRPIFVIDAYTQRLLIMLKLIEKKMKYEELQLLFHQSLPRSTYIYRQYHALIVHHSQMTKLFKKKVS